MLFAAKQVWLGPVKCITCTNFVANSKTTSLISAKTFRNLQQSDLLQETFDL